MISLNSIKVVLLPSITQVIQTRIISHVKHSSGEKVPEVAPFLWEASAKGREKKIQGPKRLPSTPPQKWANTPALPIHTSHDSYPRECLWFSQ